MTFSIVVLFFKTLRISIYADSQKSLVSYLYKLITSFGFQLSTTGGFV